MLLLLIAELHLLITREKRELTPSLQTDTNLDDTTPECTSHTSAVSN